jgi:hypothetical protein
MDRPWWTLTDGANADAGAWPQCESLGPGYEYAGPRSARRMPDDSLPSYDPDFGTSELEPAANLTDFISSCIHLAGFLVRGRVRGLLGGFGLPAHRYYPAPVRFRGRAVGDYWWRHRPHAPSP